MWKNIVEPDRPQMTILCMLIACLIPKTTHKHSEYIILVRFPTATMVARKRLGIGFTWIACLVYAGNQTTFLQ